jgi:hypothetical protein
MIRMFSVTKSEVGKRTILTIDGQLSGDYIEVVEICCNQAESEGNPIDVFLRNVSTIDESRRLHRLGTDYLEARCSSVFMTRLHRCFWLIESLRTSNKLLLPGSGPIRFAFRANALATRGSPNTMSTRFSTRSQPAVLL